MSMKSCTISENSTQPSTLFLIINAGTNVLPSETPLIDLVTESQLLVMLQGPGVNSDQMLL